MKLTSQSFTDGGAIPGEFAFAVQDAQHHIALSSNRNPHLAWEDVPAGAKSLVLVAVDPDVPSRLDDLNQEGKVIPADLPRIDLYHWSLFNIPVDSQEIAAGSHSEGITAGGKPALPVEGALRHGINGYTAWFATDEQMKGDYHGYDGPCPPWNDELVHRYVFTLYALDIPTLALADKPTGEQVVAALAGHVLAQASITGTYTLNPKLA